MFYLLLTVALNMSLPEFQPQTDVSGNYIIGSYDTVNESPVVEEVAELPAGFTREAPAHERFLLNSTRSIQTITASTKSNYRVSSSNYVQLHSGDTLYYVYLTAGITYTITSGSASHTSLSIAKDSACTPFSGSTITPDVNCYLLKNNASFTVSYDDGVLDPEPDDPTPDDPTPDDPTPDDPSGNNPSGGGSSYDDTQLLSKLDVISSKLDSAYMQFRIVVFLLLIEFCYPILLDIIKNFMGGKK